MKLWSYFLVLTFFTFACKSTSDVSSVAPNKDANTSTLTCILHSCKPGVPPSLYQYVGVGFEKIQASKLVGKDTFQFQVPRNGHRFYYVGQEGKQKMPVIFGQEEQVVLRGNCNTMRSSTLPESPINQEYNEVIKKITEFSNQSRQHSMVFQRSQNDPAKIEEVKIQMHALDQDKMNYLSTLKTKSPFLAKLMSLATYLSFHNNQGVYAHEIDYFSGTYFKQADLKDPAFNNIPYLFEGFKAFTTTLSSQAIPEDMLFSAIDQNLAKIPADGQAYQYALGGVVLALQAKNHPAFSKYGNQFIDKYKAQNSLPIAQLRDAVKKARSFATGSVAPDFTQNKPDGNPMSLSELKGKVVLLDFWASWCGPCRKENPNVLRIYNKYKSKGFDVMAVSLDKKKASWLKAIEKDGLVWHHVSDLRGWKNEVAMDYSVRSIPHTVLLDQEGRIIARNLRGPSLENKLKQIFGE